MSLPKPKLEYPNIYLNSPLGKEPAIYKWPLTYTSAGNKIDGGAEIIETIRWVAHEFEDLENPIKSILEDYPDIRSFETVRLVSEKYNNLVQATLKRAGGPLKPKTSKPCVGLVKHIIQQVYNYAVTDPDKLNQYQPFSSGVYGETSFEFISQMIEEIELTDQDVFIDLGSGVGQVVLQIAALTPCKECIGIEKADVPAKYAETMTSKFKFWMAWHGKVHNDFQLIKGDFFDSDFKSMINRATFIFVNNFAFGPEVDHELKRRFTELSDGTKIISSKRFCPPKTRVTERNLTDIGSIMNVREIQPEQKKDTVSWTDRPVSYYLHVIDTSRIERYYERLKRQQEKSSKRGKKERRRSSRKGSSESLSNDSDEGAFYGPTTRKAWSEWCNSTAHTSSSNNTKNVNTINTNNNNNNSKNNNNITSINSENNNNYGANTNVCTEVTEVESPFKAKPKEEGKAKVVVEEKEGKGGKEIKQTKQIKQIKVKEIEEVKGGKELREVKEVREAKEVREVKEVKDVKEAKEAKEVKEVQKVNEVTETFEKMDTASPVIPKKEEPKKSRDVPQKTHQIVKCETEETTNEDSSKPIKQSKLKLKLKLSLSKSGVSIKKDSSPKSRASSKKKTAAAAAVLNLLHNKTVESVAGPSSYYPQPAPGCIEQKLDSYQESTSMPDVVIRDITQWMPSGSFDKLVKDFKKKVKAFLTYMQSNEYKESICKKISEEQEKNQRLLKHEQELIKQVDHLADRLLKAVTRHCSDLKIIDQQHGLKSYLDNFANLNMMSESLTNEIDNLAGINKMLNKLQAPTPSEPPAAHTREANLARFALPRSPSIQCQKFKASTDPPSHPAVGSLRILDLSKNSTTAMNSSWIKL